jgi:hypothetical protein
MPMARCCISGNPITVGAAANIDSLRFFDAIIYTTVRGKPFAAQ